MQGNGLEIRGYEPLTPQARQRALIEIGDHSSPAGCQENASLDGPDIFVRGWEVSSKPEVLIFVHGYNIALPSAMKKLGQLVAAGRFPSNIKPFVFSWPTGKIPYYFQSVEVLEGKPVVDAFSQFLGSIQAAGVRDIHIFTHSMGLKLVIKALESPKVQELMAPQRGEVTIDQLHLRTVTLSNADYSVREFRDKAYPLLYRYCRHISLYVDKNDNALSWSSLFSRTMVLGRLGVPLFTSSNARYLLDVDIIDTSGLQDNMHSVRHSAFAVNRMMVEDLREIIVSRKRAAERLSRLVNKKGNLYCFMTTPAAVTVECV